MSAVTLGTLAERGAIIIGDGYRTRRPELSGSGFRILRVADVLNGRIEARGPDFVAESFRRQIGAKAARAGDVLVTTKGTVGRVAMMPALAEEVVYSPQLCFFRVTDRDVVDPRFLSYWFASEAFREQASHRANNTDMAAYINLADIRSLEVSLPTVGTQRAIAEVLGALDDKIAANDGLAETADDVVRAKFEGLGGTEGRLALGAVAENVREMVDPALIPPNTLYVGLEHIPRRRMWMGSVGRAGEVTSGKARFHAGDILFGKLRPYFHKVISAPESGICSTDILVVRATDLDLQGFLLAACASDRVVEACTAASEGTRMPRTSWKDLAKVDVPWPSEGAVKSFSSDVVGLRARVDAATAESRGLAALRDALLPELMSGRLRVKDAERIVEAEV
ncbi:restriction endonuclease subunit S [Jannaschia sp. R86511]|uniref:restriction endonuclease subunit S n=1 Tax=Jannaschia sp. R86511 TaxID=3093853 RepID=UPI0036D3510C